ncbi:hypothetical protein WN55_02705 [Dufourea novaeangliae]|uniref:Uncharacterized protein n=1 Tax=Dufourea novaeangliae TaxID=178035 RepID=A0A154NZ55_DUFNO|nr:hypothetical protein WN55_02705 [Dufourea novaeangliae]
MTRRLPSSYPVLALIATNLVITMPAPHSKRSPEDTVDPRNGFSSVPKILEIQLPLKIASKEDLVAWAKYVMGLMASKINITLTTVKDVTPKPVEPLKAPSRSKQSQNLKTAGFKNLAPAKQTGIARPYSTPQNLENSRYAENVRNLGNTRNPERNKNPSEFRIQDTSRYPGNSRIPVTNGNSTPRRENIIANNPSPQVFTTGALATNNFLGIRPTTFATYGISDTTVHSPFEITANINLARPEIKEPLVKGAFDVSNTLKLNDPQLFVPSFPDFGPVLDVKNKGLFPTTVTVPPPPRTYLPVTTTDSIKFPSDPFATRYYFDGVERNLTNNLGVLPTGVRYATIRPFVFPDELALPVTSVDLTTKKNLSNAAKPIINLPFEAVITFTREATIEPTTSKTENDNFFVVPTRDPPDEFPPYFDSNYTVTNESGQINVVFDDGSDVTERTNSTKRPERKKKEKKKDSQSKQPTKDKNTSTRTSMLAQLLRAITGLRRKNNNGSNSSNSDTLAVDLSPPPLRPQRLPTPQRTQTYTERTQTYTERTQTYTQRTQTYPERPSRHGRRNQTSLAQELEDDDDESNESNKGNSNEGDNGDNNSSGERSNESGRGGNDKESSEETNKSDANQSNSDESDYDDDDDDEEGGGPIKAIINLLQLVAPILEDLSDKKSQISSTKMYLEWNDPYQCPITYGQDYVYSTWPCFTGNTCSPDCFQPDTDTDVYEVIEAGIPLIQELSEGDGEEPGIDFAGILVPILLQFSEGPDGPRDSSGIIASLIQVIAPLSGPLSGPLIVPLSKQSSNPAIKSGSNSGDILKNLITPLSQPTEPGKMSLFSSLIAGAVSSLSKVPSYGKYGSDITSLVKAIVAGTIAGSSAGSSHQKDSYGAPTTYGTNYGYGQNSYQPSAEPSKGGNPIALFGTLIKDIVNGILKIVASLVNAVSGLLTASSSSTFEEETERPQTYYGPPNYQPSPNFYATPSPFMTPPPQHDNKTARLSSRHKRL